MNEEKYKSGDGRSISENSNIFRSLFTSAAASFHKNMIKIIGKYSGQKPQFIEKIVDDLVRKHGGNDVAIMTALYQMRPILTKEMNINSGDRAADRAADIIKVLEELKIMEKIKDYHAAGRIFHILDIGCADGSILIALRAAINKILIGNGDSEGSPNTIKLHGTDIYPAIEINADSGIDFIINEEKSLAFKNESMDLVLCLMTLHHLKHLDVMLKEIGRVLVADSGRFIYREHDLPKDKQYAELECKFLDLVHIMADAIFHPIEFGRFDKKIDIPAPVQMFINRHYSNYKSAEDWNTLINKCFGNKNDNKKILYYNKFKGDLFGVGNLLAANPQQVYMAAAGRD